MTATVTRGATWPRSVSSEIMGLVPGKEFPGDWPMVRLGEVLAFSNGVNADKRAYGQGVPFVNVLEVITSSHLRTSDIPGRVLLSKAQRDTFHVRREDILFNRTSETQEEVGLSAVYEDDERVVFGGFVIRGRPTSDGLEPQYAGYALRALAVRSQIIAKAQGAVRANIAQATLKEVLVPLPDLPEQRAIAQVLSDVDRLLEALGALIAKKRATKQAAMQQLLTGTIRLPGFRGKWKTTRLGEIGVFAKGRGIRRDDVIAEGLPCILYGELYTRYHEYVTAPGSRISPTVAQGAMPISRGDLLFTASGETAKEIGTCVTYLGAVEAYAGGDIIVMTASSHDSRFLAHLLNLPSVAAQRARFAQGHTVVHISVRNLAQIELELPPLEEQSAIATVLADMDAEIAALERCRDKTRAIKQGMMQQLLTGRVRLVEPEATT